MEETGLPLGHYDQKRKKLDDERRKEYNDMLANKVGVAAVKPAMIVIDKSYAWHNKYIMFDHMGNGCLSWLS